MMISLAILLLRNARSVKSTSSGLSSTSRISSIGRSSRSAQGEVERGAFADLAFGPDVPAVAVDDALDGGEADAAAWKVRRRVQPLERPEQVRGEVRVVAGAVVANVERGHAMLIPGRANFDRRLLAAAGELPGVLDQVLQRES